MTDLELPTDDEVPPKRDVKPTRCPLPGCADGLKSEHQDRLANVTDTWVVRCPEHGEVHVTVPLVDDPEPYLRALQARQEGLDQDPQPRRRQQRGGPFRSAGGPQR